jgi:hypothetical protein
MEKPFNDISNEVMDILPIVVEEEDVVEEETKEPIPDIEEEDVFGGKDLEETEKLEEPAPVLKVKKGNGKRGPDKKPRKKKIVSEAVIAALSKAREASRAKREEIKDERSKIRLEIKEKEKQLIKERLEAKKMPETPPPSPKEKIGFKGFVEPSEKERLMGILDEWDAKKKLTKQRKKEQLQNQKKKEQLQNQPHPAGRNIPQTQLPQPPPNPFDEIFKYKGSNRSTYW